MGEQTTIKHLLARLSPSISLDDEPEKYILTPKEEQAAIDHAVERKKHHMIWKWGDKVGDKYSQQEIAKKVSETNFLELINREEILKIANSNKIQELWYRERRLQEAEERIKKQEELKSAWTANRMYQFMKWNAQKIFSERGDDDRKFIFNDKTRKLITTICFFLSGDPRFESELGFSFSKGLWIRGISGLGKTFLFQCVQDNELNPVLILSMLDIADEVRTEGEFRIDLGDRKVLYLDDVGSEEPTVNHFGTKINFFKQFIELTYLKNKTFGKLIVSTNNDFNEIESKYGFRVRSRSKEMFNIVDVEGVDMR